jgi:tetratricopeptide (TPR) repeat protein
MIRALFLLLAMLVASMAMAQSEPTRARSLYEEARKYFEASQYKEALALFQESYTLSEEPTLLFNIGQCYRLQQQCKEANNSFRRFLQKIPDAPNRAQVERLIAECPEPTAAPTSTPALPTTPLDTASLTFATKSQKASYQVSIETNAKTFRCTNSITPSSTCTLPELPPGDVRIIVTGSRKLSKELSLSVEESTFEIEQRGYAVPIVALSAPPTAFLLGATGSALSGNPGLDSLGIGAALGVLTAVLVTPVILVVDRYVLPPHKTIRKTLSQPKSSRAKLSFGGAP